MGVASGRGGVPGSIRGLPPPRWTSGDVIARGAHKPLPRILRPGVSNGLRPRASTLVADRIAVASADCHRLARSSAIAPSGAWGV